MATCLVIGAGMAGLTAAGRLAAAGIDVVVVDRGRAVGGRMATRRVGDAAFDSGVQHFGVRTPAFLQAVADWRAAGAARVWYRSSSRALPGGAVEDRMVGVGGMRRIPEAIADCLDVQTGVRVESLLVGDRVTAYDYRGRVATADAVVITPPVWQTLGLLEIPRGASPHPSRVPLNRGEWVDRLGGVDYDAALAVLATLAESPDLPDGHLAIDSPDVAWMADNHHKGVSTVPALTIHSTAAFALRHLGDPPWRWIGLLVEAALRHVDVEIVDAVGHGWRYAEPQQVFDVGAVRLEAPSPVVLAGEIFSGARVEGAFTSGVAAAALLESML